MVLITICGLWVVAATLTALLPMRRQFLPGVTLLVLAPVLIVLLGMEFGLWVALAALLAFLSMFRNPLRYFARRGWGRVKGRHDA